MKVERQITLTLNGPEAESLVSLLKVAYDKSPDLVSVRQECDRFIKQIKPSGE